MGKSDNYNYSDFATILEVINVCNKYRYQNALEDYEIYKYIQKGPNNDLNDQLKFKSNQIYDTTISIRNRNRSSTSDVLPVAM